MSLRVRLAGVVALAAGLRILASLNDLWLDEVWSWSLAQKVSSVSDVLTIHHDNNHPLNTAWIRLVGADGNGWLYRLPAVVSGLLFVVVLIFFRREALHAQVAGLVTGTSFVLVQYSSEARGYGPATLFALIAWQSLKVLETADSRPDIPTGFQRWRKCGAGLVYVVSVFLGMLAHATFLFVLGAFWVHSLSILVTRCRLLRATVQTASYQLPTLVAALAFVWLFARHLEIGGGDSQSVGHVMLSALSLVLGGPASGAFAFATGAISVCLFLTAVCSEFRRCPHQALFFIAIAVAPFVWVAVWPPNPFYERYFLLPMAFSLILISEWLANLIENKGFGRRLAIVTLIALVILNVSRDVRLIAEGRGHYRQALQDIQNASTGDRVVIGSDHDFRNSLLVEYHRRQLPDRPTIEYVREGRWPGNGPDWVILHDTAETFNPPQGIEDAAGNLYDREAVYGHSGLSGMSWAVYRNRRSASLPSP
ncbi:MAG: hypothetical protein R3C49_13760 [Planctomycetaceae bacterium]